uniref:Uncharacterized protein n=1 Tax=Oryza barthii TaxID=65489 RepID=A0A0D3HBP0_9ORYZ
MEKRSRRRLPRGVGGREIRRGAAGEEELVAGRSGGGQREKRKRWRGDPPCSPLAARHAPARPSPVAPIAGCSWQLQREREEEGREKRERKRGKRSTTAVGLEITWKRGERWRLHKDKTLEEKEAYIKKLHKDKMTECFKQPSSTNLCGYYMLEMLRVNRRYTTNINHTPEISYVADQFDNTTIMKVCADICHFIRRDCCNALGQSYDNESQLALEDKFKPLREWEKEHMQ